MKKTILSIIFLLILFVMPTMVFAAEGDVAQVGTETFTSLEDALNKAMGTEDEVILLKDATLTSTYVVTDDLKINLNGFNITAVNKLFQVKGAEFTVEGKGMLEETTPDYAPIYVYGTDDSNASNYTVINIGSDVTLKGWAGIMIKNTTNNHAYGVVVNCEGTMISEKDSGGITGSGVYVNGFIKDTENYPVINLNSATILTSTGTGVYGAGFAKWNITDTKITAYEMGVGIKSGIFTLNNVDITVNGPYALPTGNGNGINPTGAAIQIEEYKSYAGQIDLTINSGNYTSENNSALLEYTTSVDGVTFVENIAINGGTFNSTEGKDAITLSESFEGTITQAGFIKRGTFSTEVPRKYLANAVTISEQDGIFRVGVKNMLLPEIIGKGTFTPSLYEAIVGEKIKLTAKPEEGYKLESLKVYDVNGDEIEIKENEFTMPDCGVIVKVDFIKLTQNIVIPEDIIEDSEKVEDILRDSLKESLNSYDVDVVVKVELTENNVSENEKEEIKQELDEVEMKIGKYFDITVAVRDAETGEKIDQLNELTDKIKFTIDVSEDLPKLEEGFARKYFIIRNHEGKIEYLDVIISEDGKSLSFETNKFSTYVLGYRDEATSGEGDAETEGTEEPKEEIKEEIKEEVKEEVKEENTNNNIPNTGDNIALYVLLATIAIVGIITIKKINTKK